jgi:hypothetical protein
MYDLRKSLNAPRMVVQKIIKRENMKPIGNLSLVRKVKNMMR